MVSSGIGSVTFRDHGNLTLSFRIAEVGLALVIVGQGGGAAIGVVIPNPTTHTDQIDVTTLGPLTT